MNILPKKSWHVRKKENIARVRKDEAEAAEKEKEIERRAKLASQEARLSFLREKAREKNEIVNDDVKLPDIKEHSKFDSDIYTSAGNINFFKDAESGIRATGSNKEYEEEKKNEKEAQEKKIGLLTYLGQDTLEASGKIAWFSEKHRIVSRYKTKLEDCEEIGIKSKVKLDPLNEIIKHVGPQQYDNLEMGIEPLTEKIVKHKNKSLCRKNKKHKEKRKKNKNKYSSLEMEGKKVRKHSKHKKKRKRESSEEEEDLEQKESKIRKLRDERLKREAHERKREERLLAGKNPDEVNQVKSNLPFQQKYNSQFNPQFAKQNLEKSTLLPGVKYWLT